MISRILQLNILFLCLAWSVQAQAQVRHEVYLSNTEHELNVYRIYGDEPGKTIMIIGGIQGDEPGSYMTADLYADINLKKGNLIVVPRANLYSILLNRRNGLTGDMNRKFGRDNNNKKHLEEEIVAILKRLIAESDCLLNLHEGSGFYAPRWINNQENPQRYGQSIIYDTETFPVPGQDRIISLGDLARKIVARVNQQIDNQRWHFKPNNHDSLSETSLHREQRKSATFYALTGAHIPAFGVETSKSITDLKTKILLQKLVINTFMEEMGIILDTPGVTLEKPQLDYILIKVNDKHPVALGNGSILKLAAGDEITVTDIIANYQRGLVADIQNMGTKNDTNIPFRIADATKVIIRKDAEECGWVQIETTELQTAQTAAVQTQAAEPPPRTTELQSGATAIQPPAPTNEIKQKPPVPLAELRAETLLVNVEDQINPLAEGHTLKITKGKRLILQGIKTNIPYIDPEIFINFKGFAPPKSVNDGNDLHYPIYSGQDLWPRYSKNRQGKIYPIIATYNDKPIGSFWIELMDP